MNNRGGRTFGRPLPLLLSVGLWVRQEQGDPSALAQS